MRVLSKFAVVLLAGVVSTVAQEGDITDFLGLSRHERRTFNTGMAMGIYAAPWLMIDGVSEADQAMQRHYDKKIQWVKDCFQNMPADEFDNLISRGIRTHQDSVLRHEPLYVTAVLAIDEACLDYHE